MMRINRALSSLVGILILGLAVACGAAENDTPAAAPDNLSDFPTPTQSLASTNSDTSDASESSGSQTQPNEATDGGDVAENEPISEEELQQILERIQNGEMSPEEFMQIAEQIEAQFGGELGGFGGMPGTQAFGTIKSIDGNAITIETETGPVTANLANDTMISVTSVLDPSELTEGMQVTAFSERIDGRTTARIIAIEPEGQEAGFGQRGQGGGGFGGAFTGRQRIPNTPGQAGFPGGNEEFRPVESAIITEGPGGPGVSVVFESTFTEDGSLGSDGQAGGGGFAGPMGVPPLFGSIESISGNVITIDTQQGPLPVTLDDETIISRTKQGTIEDLQVGMEVTAFGPPSEDGAIEARVVNTLPEGMDDFGAFGSRRRAGFGRGVGGQGAQ